MKKIFLNQFVNISKFEIILHFIIPLFFIVPVLKESIVDGKVKLVILSIVAIVLTVIIAILRIKFSLIDKNDTKNTGDENTGNGVVCDRKSGGRFPD